MIKRSLTTIIGLPAVLVILIFGNKYILDVIMAILAIMGIYEYMKCVAHKFNPVYWIGYVAAASIALLHIIPSNYLIEYLPIVILSLIAVLFMHVVFTDMKTNAADIAITLFGILYIVGFFSFVALLYGYESNGRSLGKFYIAYLFLATWGSDVFAYLVGVKFGKHRFSKISPKKSIEGCIAGTVGATLIMLIYTYICNTYLGMNFNYLYIILIGIVLSLVGQIGDLSASSIKRYTGIKDFSNLIPGHGGMLDRIDSVIFIAPFAYFLLMLL